MFKTFVSLLSGHASYMNCAHVPVYVSDYSHNGKTKTY